MKKSVLLIFLVLLCGDAFGQVEWVSDIENPCEIKTFTLTSQDQHVINLTHDSEFSSDPVPAVLAIDGQDGELFELSGFPWEPWSGTYITIVSDVIELEDSSFVFPAVLFGVDPYGTGLFSHRVAKVTKDWTDTEWRSYSIFTVEGVFGDRVSDNGFVLFDPLQSQVTRLDGDCSTIWSDLTDFQIYDLAVTSNDRLVWTGNEGLVLMNINGNTGLTYPQFQFEEIQVTGFDGFIGLKEDTLSLLSPDFEQFDSGLQEPGFDH